MRYIFLDIDGVLNSLAWSRRKPTPGRWDLDPACIARVNYLCEATGADVVISSSWRTHMKPRHLVELLTKQGLRANIIGLTPYLVDRLEEAPRGDEINQWIAQNVTANHNAFVILDDRDDMQSLIRYLVQTDGEIGITDADVDRAISMLT